MYLQELRSKCFVIFNQPNIQSLLKLEQIFFSAGLRSGILHIFKNKLSKVIA